jgi:PiT family inorganic phosphate transporter
MVLSKVVLPALIAPFTAGVIAFLATRLAYAITRRYDNKPDGRDGFRWGQIFTSSLVALAHGTNDAQKTMGVITLALIMVGWQSAAQADPQLWVILACAFTIALGTYMGGWRIIRTLGKGLTDVKPAQGFSAETSTAATILASSALGFALSTTQVASGRSSAPDSAAAARRCAGAPSGASRRVGADAAGLRRRRRVRGAPRRLVRQLGHPRRRDPRGRGHRGAVPALAEEHGRLFERDERGRRFGSRRQGPRKAPPTRRQRAIMREEARLRAEAQAREKAARKHAAKEDAKAKARKRSRRERQIGAEKTKGSKR